MHAEPSFAPRIIIAVLVAVAFAAGLWLGNAQRDASNATAIVAGVRAGMAATTPCAGVVR